ncbi:MAG: integration host factor subunit beta [Deltaproteobacteria bacterium]|nr:integration host factor subunit beta [Deltaproteobacteria bacterium]
MNRSGLISLLKNETTLCRKDAEKAVDVFFDAITGTLSKGERVEIRDFSSFTAKHYMPYVVRNPKTGVRINVPSKKLPFFKIGKELKAIVDN